MLNILAEQGIRLESGTGPPLYLGTKAAKNHCLKTFRWEGAVVRRIQKSEDLPEEIKHSAWNTE